MNIEPWTSKTPVAAPWRGGCGEAGHEEEENRDENRKDFFSK